LSDRNSFNPLAQPDPVNSRNWGNWSVVAPQILLKKDYLFQVATIIKG